MAVNLPSNTTCDVYTANTQPPAAPRVSGVKILLTGDYMRRMETGEGETSPAFRYTHVALTAIASDIRDPFGDWSVGVGDSLYVPDKNGTRFLVRKVDTPTIGSAVGQKRIYLDRKQPTWPTNNL
jgi:hypothetical protein